MCGRYASTKEPAQLVEEFGVTVPLATEQAASPDYDVSPDYTASPDYNVSSDYNVSPDYNVAPTKTVLAVLDRDIDGHLERLLKPVRWGLVPSWAKDAAIGNRMINARVETASTKPAYRRAWARRRALLPADGFYEWHASPSEGGKPRKQPYFIHRADGRTLAMAGLYEIWRDPSRDRDDPAAWLWTVTVLTTEATDAAGHIHDRMPIDVAPERWAAWLDPDFAGDPATLLDPTATAAGLTAYPVSTKVNSVRNNGPELLEPLPAS